MLDTHPATRPHIHLLLNPFTPLPLHISLYPYSPLLTLFFPSLTFPSYPSTFSTLLSTLLFHSCSLPFTCPFTHFHDHLYPHLSIHSHTFFFSHSLTFCIHLSTLFSSFLTFFKHFCFTETTINTETTTSSIVTQLPLTFSSPLLHHHHNYCCTALTDWLAGWLLLSITFGWPSVHSFLFLHSFISLAFYSFVLPICFSRLSSLWSSQSTTTIAPAAAACTFGSSSFSLLFCSSWATAAFAQQQSPRSTVHGPASVHCPV